MKGHLGFWTEYGSVREDSGEGEGSRCTSWARHERCLAEEREKTLKWDEGELGELFEETMPKGISKSRRVLGIRWSRRKLKNTKG